MARRSGSVGALGGQPPRATRQPVDPARDSAVRTLCRLPGGRLITWEIKALAGEEDGVKQGLFVGFAASVALIGIRAPKERWLEVALFTAVGTFALCRVGGWFGGNLFPPVLKLNQRLGSLVSGILPPKPGAPLPGGSSR
jgi:hypothetical protein